MGVKRCVETIETKQIEIVVNGESRIIPAGSDIAGLLGFLGIDPGKVAVELNRAIVRKKDWAVTVVPPAAQVEIVWFVGGG